MTIIVITCPQCNTSYHEGLEKSLTRCPSCSLEMKVSDQYKSQKLRASSTILTLTEEAKALEEIRKERTILNKQASFISSLQANLLEVMHDNSVELRAILSKQIVLDVAEREVLLEEERSRKQYGFKVYTGKQEDTKTRDSLGI